MSRLPFSRSNTVDSLLTMLATLRHAPNGAPLLAQLMAGKKAHDAIAALAERAFAGFVKNAVDRYAKTAPIDPTTRLKLKMIEHRLEALLGAREAAAPALGDVAALEQHLIAALWATAAPVSSAPAPAEPTAAPAPSALAPLHDALDAQLDRATDANLDGIASLGSIAQTLNSVPPEALAEWRDILREAVHELVADYRRLGERLGEARHCAKEIARHTEATAALTVSARGELLKRLEAEARRATRHRHPLSIALLNPDHVDDIRQVVGGDAVREVLRFYRESIASCARAYDTVAGYNPHGLFWLLPAANTEQSVRALRKAQQRLAEAHYHYGGKLRRLPTFSAAVAGYTPGEAPAALLARVETLAAKARRAGPNRIERDGEALAVAPSA